MIICRKSPAAFELHYPTIGKTWLNQTLLIRHLILFKDSISNKIFDTDTMLKC